MGDQLHSVFQLLSAVLNLYVFLPGLSEFNRLNSFRWLTLYAVFSTQISEFRVLRKFFLKLYFPLRVP